MKKVRILGGIFCVVLVLYLFFNFFEDIKLRFEEDRATFLQEKAALKKEIKFLRKEITSLSTKITQLQEKRLSSRNGAPFLNEAVEQKKKGKVLAVDKTCNLIIVDLGRKDGVEEQDRLKILKDGKEIAQGRVIGVRYHASAAFVDEVEYNYHVRNIEKGDSVSILD